MVTFNLKVSDFEEMKKYNYLLGYVNLKTSLLGSRYFFMFKVMAEIGLRHKEILVEHQIIIHL